MSDPTHQVTQLLKNWENGDEGALHALMPLVYAELRKIAHRHLRRQAQSPSLESRELVHELYLKIPNLRELRWEGRVGGIEVTDQDLPWRKKTPWSQSTRHPKGDPSRRGSAIQRLLPSPELLSV